MQFGEVSYPHIAVLPNSPSCIDSFPRNLLDFLTSWDSHEHNSPDKYFEFFNQNCDISIMEMQKGTLYFSKTLHISLGSVLFSLIILVPLWRIQVSTMLQLITFFLKGQDEVNIMIHENDHVRNYVSFCKVLT